MVKIFTLSEKQRRRHDLIIISYAASFLILALFCAALLIVNSEDENLRDLVGGFILLGTLMGTLMTCPR